MIRFHIKNGQPQIHRSDYYQFYKSDLLRGAALFTPAFKA
jgi:hypothetical protein